MSLDRLMLFVILIWVFLYTISFGGWTWKSKNKLGALMIFAVALATLVLPIYTLFFRE